MNEIHINESKLLFLHSHIKIVERKLMGTKLMLSFNCKYCFEISFIKESV